VNKMPYVIEHYDPNDEKYYTSRAGNPEAAEQLKKVLEHLGMKEVTVFEEKEQSQNEDILTVTLLRQDARDLNYWVLRKLDHDCYSESSKLQFERIHKALLKGIHGTEKVPEREKKIKELQEVINNSKPDDPYFDSEEFNEEWDRVMAREERGKSDNRMTLEESIKNIKTKLDELPPMTEEELKAWADGQLEEAKKIKPVVY